MRLAGRVFRVGRWWAVEVPILGVATQGRTKKDALFMIADAIESLVNREGFRVEVFADRGERLEIGAEDQGALTALLLRRARHRSGLSLSEVADRLGSSSANAYARYEQGRAVPTLRKLTQLFAAVAPGGDFVLDEGRAPRASG